MASPARQAGDGPQLPDLDIIARGYQSIATELPKFRNVPAFDQGAEILNEMRGMREEMRKMNEKIDREMQRVNEKIDRFDGRFGAINVNNVARLINSSLADSDGQLSRLHNVATNEPIDRFPATPGAIKDMPAAALNTVLKALGMETNGGLEQKRQRLRVQIGLNAVPV